MRLELSEFPGVVGWMAGAALECSRPLARSGGRCFTMKGRIVGLGQERMLRTVSSWAPRIELAGKIGHGRG